MAWTISNAMMRDYENSRYSLALVAESSGVICSDGEQFAQSSTTPMPDQYYWPDKTTEHSRLSRFGMTCVHLTESHGEELLTLYRAGFPVRTSAQLEKVMDWMASEVGYGRKWLGLLARLDRDLFSWKTPQSSLVEGLDVFSQTWPAWDSMRTGECWERTTSEVPTCATEYGLWPTPCATDSSDRKVSARMHETKKGTFKHIGENGTLSQVRLSQVVKHRTPLGVGRLSADWTEWFLMGWPIGHTDLRPLETVKFREWRQQHGGF